MKEGLVKNGGVADDNNKDSSYFEKLITILELYIIPVFDRMNAESMAKLEEAKAELAKSLNDKKDEPT